MIKKLVLTLFAVGIVASAAVAQTYTGNGATGFGGTLGNASLTINDDGMGALTFNFTTGTNFTGNDIVIYIDSVASGFADTSQFSDNGDGGRTAMSGFRAMNPDVDPDADTRTLAIFAGGFEADFAISFEPGFAGLFSLAAGGNNSLGFVDDLGLSGSGMGWSFTLNLSDIGLTPGDSFDFVGTLISTTAYRSDETLGLSSTTPGTPGDAPNAGFTGSTTWETFETFTTVPEASSLSLLAGPAILGAWFFIRRRRRA